MIDVQPKPEASQIEPEVALMIAMQAMEAALHSLDRGGTLEARDAIWQALAAIKRE